MPPGIGYGEGVPREHEQGQEEEERVRGGAGGAVCWDGGGVEWGGREGGRWDVCGGVFVLFYQRARGARGTRGMAARPAKGM